MSDIPQSLRSALGRLLREVRAYPTALRPRSGDGRVRRVAFFPSSGREQSGLLRAYLVAEALEDSGWQTLVVPKHLRQGGRRRLLRLFRPDVCVLQTCRHPLNRIAHFRDQRVVLDLDDADFFDEALRDDMAQVARAAAGVICGSRFIRDWAAQFCERTTVVWTGTPMLPGPWPDHGNRARIVTWAQSDPVGYAREFDLVTDILTRVRAAGTAPFTLRLYGWDGPQDHPNLDRLRAAGVGLELLGTLPYDRFLQSLRDCAIGLSPLVSQTDFNKGKSFGKILGYLDAKVPVIASDAADNALFFRAGTGVVSNDPDLWADEIAALLDAPDRRQAMADAAYGDFRLRLSIEQAAKRVAGFLGSVTQG